jgi:hypothetical protein
VDRAVATRDVDVSISLPLKAAAVIVAHGTRQ